MAGHPKDTEAEPAPGDDPVRAEYERDFYSWSMEQARHLRDGRFGALDRENLGREIESLGREQFNKLVSALRVAMLHMLKWDHQSAKRSRSWMLSIEEQRLKLTTCWMTIPASNRALPRPLPALTAVLASMPLRRQDWTRRNLPRLGPIRSTISPRAFFPSENEYEILTRHARPDAGHPGLPR
jgi:hypothetical protein